MLCFEVFIYVDSYKNTDTRYTFSTRTNLCVFTHKRIGVHIYAQTHNLHSWKQETPRKRKTAWPLKPSHLWLHEKRETSCVAQKWVHRDVELRMRALERLRSYEQRPCGDFRPEFCSSWQTIICFHRLVGKVCIIWSHCHYCDCIYCFFFLSLLFTFSMTNLLK